MSIRERTEEAVKTYLGVTDLTPFQNSSDWDLHDPMELAGMDRLIVNLHEIHENPNAFLTVMSDYDTDGVMAAGILTGGLSRLGFRFGVWIPDMNDGYGISVRSITKAMGRFPKTTAILTADNGITAVSGVAYARSIGLTVLVTDHHPESGPLPNAHALVDPMQRKDRYPFSGISGATVAWKTLMAYAAQYEIEALPDIEKLQVFAGVSAVADVMPMLDENRYLVREAMAWFGGNDDMGPNLPHTGYELYDTVFKGLYELDRELGSTKNNPLPANEERISWYLSPLLNAPRRVHGSSLEAMMAILAPNKTVRHTAAHRLIELNKEKSKMRDKALKEVKTPELFAVIHAEKGIAGLVAAEITKIRNAPSFVFVERNGWLSGSARAPEGYSLKKILEEVNRVSPGLIKGGGHEGAAGVSLNASDYEKAKRLTEHAIETIGIPSPTVETGVQIPVDLTGNTDGLTIDLANTYHLIETLRPFGKGFLDEPVLELKFGETLPNYNPDFWGGRGIKWSYNNAEVLTFNGKTANQIRNGVRKGFTGHIRKNTFRGKETMQIQLL